MNSEDNIHFPADEARALADGAGVGLYILQNDQFRYVNEWMARQLGYDKAQELIGKTFTGMVHPEDRHLIHLEIPPDTDAGFSNPPSFRLFKKDGSPLWVQMSGRSITYQGQPANAGCLLDTTSFRRKFEDLQDSLERYETILDDVDVHLSEIDLRGNITFINDAGCRMWKLPREELMGMNYRHYMKDRDVRQYDELYRKVFFTGIPVQNIILEVTDREGKQRTIEKSVSLARDASGKIYGFRMVSRDVTEKREAEKRLAEQRSRLEAIFGSVKDAIITVDPGLAVIDANKSTESICSIAVKDI
ncbi:MAG: PAS domain-containing protein, partial [Deltaproteobacteria bacterium]